MSHRPIIDAGPGLNFLSIHKERLLIGTLGPLCAPETVRDELIRKSRHNQRFSAAETVWRKLPERLMQILPDEVTPELEAVVVRISHLPMVERLKRSKDLGETMVIAHAVMAAEAGEEVTVLIDEQDGAAIATMEADRLKRHQKQGKTVGAIRVASSPTVLAKAAGGQYLPDKNSMRDTHWRLCELDDGLTPIDTTNLLSPGLWP